MVEVVVLGVLFEAARLAAAQAAQGYTSAVEVCSVCERNSRA